MKCNGYNHFSKVFKNVVNQIENRSASTRASIIREIQTRDDWNKRLNIQGKEICFKIDTNSDVNIIPLNEFEQMKKRNNYIYKLKLKGSLCNSKVYGEYNIKVVGENIF